MSMALRINAPDYAGRSMLSVVCTIFFPYFSLHYPSVTDSSVKQEVKPERVSVRVTHTLDFACKYMTTFLILQTF